jgi:hypothetical protein
MSTATRRIVVFLVFTAALLPPKHLLAEEAIGLYYPDFRALRQLINLNGEPALPRGPGYDDLATAWNGLCEDGRDLLLKEKDVVLVVVRAEGTWLWRSSRIPTLRELQVRKQTERTRDYDRLRAILTNPWYMELRDFYDHVLFSQNSVAVPERFGELLERADKLPNAVVAQKNWCKAIIGTRLSAADEPTRAKLMQDRKYGKQFRAAMILADSRRAAQIKEVAQATSKPGTVGPALKFTFDKAKELLTFGLADDASQQMYPLAVVDAPGGRHIVSFPAESGTIYVATLANNADSEWFKSGFSFDEVEPLVLKGEADVFYASHGSNKVVDVANLPKPQPPATGIGEP